MPLFPFPLKTPNIAAWNLAAKIRQPFMSVTTALGRLGFDTIGNPVGRTFKYTGSAPPNIPAVYTDDYFSSIGRHAVPKEFCFIIVLDTKTNIVIPFQFMPKTIGDVKAANYQDVHIIGRSSPFKSYSSSSARTVSFALDFYATPEQGDTEPTPKTIKKYITQLQALLYPIYDNYSISPPPRCIVHIGDQINMVAICKNVSVSYNSQQIPWTTIKQASGYYVFGASVALSFEEVKDIPVGYYEKLEGKDDEGQREEKLPEYDPSKTDGLPADFDEGGVETDPDFTPAGGESGKKANPNFVTTAKPIVSPSKNPGE